MSTTTVIATTTTSASTAVETEGRTLGDPDGEAKLDKLITEKTLEINNLVASDADKILRKLSKDGGDAENWARLLLAAPTALTALGFCFAAAKAAGTGDIQQTLKPHLPPDLKTNIVDCHDKGVSAFILAHKKMSSLSLCMDNILEPGGTMDSIEESICEAKDNMGDPEMLRQSLADLEAHVKELRTVAKRCTTESNEVLQTFEKWADLTKSVHLAFTNTLSRRGSVKMGWTEIKSESKKGGKWSAIAGAVSEAVSGVVSGTVSRTKRLKRLMARSSPEKPEKITQEEREGIKEIFLSPTEADVIIILEFCLDNLGKIKASLVDLNDFFQRLHTKIENVSEQRIPKLDALATGGKNVRNSVASGKNPKAIQLEILKIRIDYMVAGAKAAMYAKASRSYIMPGVDIVISLSEETGDKVEAYQIDDLITYSENVREDIRKLTEFAKEAEQKVITTVIVPDGPKRPGSAQSA